MKKIFVRIAGTLSMLLVVSACMKSPVQELEFQEKLSNTMYSDEFMALAESEQTKTALQWHSVVWSEDDRVAIFRGSDKSQEYKVKAGAAGGCTTSLIPLKSNVSSGGMYNSNVAFYPYNEAVGLSCENGKFLLTVDIPPVQTYTEESFSCGSMPMIAVSSLKERKLQFLNVFGVLKLRMKSNNLRLSSIMVEGNNGEKLSGSSIISYSPDGEPSIAFDASSSTSLVLTCGSAGLSPNSGGEFEFYIPLPPCVFKKGISVTFVTVEGEKIVKKINKEIVIKRSTILPLQEGILTDEKYIDLIYNVSSTASSTLLWYPGAVGSFNESPFICSGDSPITITRVVYDGDEVATNYLGQTHYFKRTGDVNVRVYYKGDLTSAGFGSYGYTGTWGNRKECRLKGIVVPESVSRLTLKDLPVLSSVSCACSSSFKYCLIKECPSLSEINGPLATEDGRCLLSEDGTLVTFAPCGVTEYHIPEGVRSISDECFYGNKTLTDLWFPSTLESIGRKAFDGCRSLRIVNGLEHVLKFGESAFNSTAIESISISGAVEIGNSVFRNCKKLVSVSLPASLTKISDYLFSGCAELENIRLPDGLKSIGIEAFSNCISLASIAFPSGVSEIGVRCFMNTPLHSLQIPKSIRTIGESAFYGTHVKSISFEKGGSQLTKIEDSVFGLVDADVIRIPASVSYIGDSAFKDCKNLISVSFENGSVLTEFSSYSSNGAFCGCTSLSEIELPGSLKDLGTGTFYGCTALKECLIPASVQKIGGSAFCCSGIKKIIIPDSVKSIGGYAFHKCNSLEEVIIGAGLISMDVTSFLWCPEIKKIVSTSSSYVSSSDNMFLLSPEGVVTLFANKNTLTQYSFPEQLKGVNVREIAPLLFTYNRSVETVRLPKTMEVIGMKSFWGKDWSETIKHIYCEALTPPKLMWTDPIIGDSMGGWMVGKSVDPFPDSSVFYVPSGSIELYRKEWNQHSAFYPIP